ncbi:hypothetical protein [Polyangium mundeleinium]|uniref:HTH gntR-type domain-containing protein n=1 Tax=Polyangium mundeleinium TaxID=2995306 RepID=A0ABT5F8L7_9BACT|nr:hypothetical protein [Polyangium mundeleinium]MDC0750009.1 hypothetical protein [Polyangium mundeleinium]
MLKTEWMMYQPLADFFGNRGMVVLREVTTHEGRVDLVAAHVDWVAARRRQKMGLVRGLTSMTLLRAWEVLPLGEPITIDDWADKLAISTRTVRELARELDALGFVVKDSNTYIRSAVLQSLITELACCEAKLQDWKRGLRQAYGHRFYADRTYLALANRIPQTVDRVLLESRQIGLISVVDDDVRIELAAQPRQPNTTLTRRFLEERFWEHGIEPLLRARGACANPQALRATA